MDPVIQHPSTQRFRSVWISDLHLGSRGCQAHTLLRFLRGFECEYLYLVGDIFDIWQLKRRIYWPQSHNDVLRTLLGKAKHGTKILYVPGNHDEYLKDFCGHEFGNIKICRQAIHQTNDGKRFLVLHGDQFDAAVLSSRLVGQLGSCAYEALLGTNMLVNQVRRRLGYPYWSLAGFLKHKVKNAVKFISRYEEVVAHEASRRGVDGVVCGHIHRAEITRIGDISYHNCGDWVESCTAIIEHRDGSIDLYRNNADARDKALEQAA